MQCHLAGSVLPTGRDEPFTAPEQSACALQGLSRAAPKASQSPTPPQPLLSQLLCKAVQGNAHERSPGMQLSEPGRRKHISS